jgi:uncharacterized protein
MAQYASQAEYREEGTQAVANPAPLGFLILALTTALVGACFARFLVPSVRVGISTVAAPVFIYGGVIQVLAGMWAFRKNLPLVATLFSAYGGFLVALGAVFVPVLGLTTLFGPNVLAFNHALGLLFLCWTVCSAVILIGSLKTNTVLLALLGCFCLAYLFLAIGEFANANGPLLAIGGWLGIICALVAWYMALGSLLQATHSSIHIPMGASREKTLSAGRRYEGDPAV